MLFIVNFRFYFSAKDGIERNTKYVTLIHFHEIFLNCCLTFLGSSRHNFITFHKFPQKSFIFFSFIFSLHSRSHFWTTCIKKIKVIDNSWTLCDSPILYDLDCLSLSYCLLFFSDITDKCHVLTSNGLLQLIYLYCCFRVCVRIFLSENIPRSVLRITSSKATSISNVKCVLLYTTATSTSLTTKEELHQLPISTKCMN